MEKIFEHGRLLSEKYWTDEGVLIEERTLCDYQKHRNVTKWDTLGTLRFKLTHDSEGQGHVKQWDQEGQEIHSH
jgi:hypothetical protein